MTVWLSRELILAIHDEQLAEHGGSPGLRDAGLLDSALARRLNRAGYAEPDVAELGAVYALGIARNHPFIDGNKRTAFVALELFLRLNGCVFAVGDADAAVMMLAMASGERSRRRVYRLGATAYHGRRVTSAGFVARTAATPIAAIFSQQMTESEAVMILLVMRQVSWGEGDQRLKATNAAAKSKLQGVNI